VTFVEDYWQVHPPERITGPAGVYEHPSEVEVMSHGVSFTYVDEAQRLRRVFLPWASLLEVRCTFDRADAGDPDDEPF
jgi:hypothetical protein